MAASGFKRTIFKCKVKRITTNSTNPCFILATFRTCFFSPFSSLMMKTLSYKYYNKQITTHDNGNVQSHDKNESKLNSTITANESSKNFLFSRVRILKSS